MRARTSRLANGGANRSRAWLLAKFADFSIGALLVSLVGAVILLAIVNLFRRGRVR